MSMKYSILLLIALIALLINACGSRYQTYTSPPQRTVSLDSVKIIEGPKRIPPPDTLEVTFEVVGDSLCPVKIELRDVMTRFQRMLVDSVYSPGSYSFRWVALDSLGNKLRENRYYYKIYSCDQVHTKKFDYRSEIK